MDAEHLAGLMPDLVVECGDTFAPAIRYRCIAVLRAGAKTPALAPVFGRICSKCCDEIDMLFSRREKPQIFNIIYLS
jgi:hypothetical protein